RNRGEHSRQRRLGDLTRGEAQTLPPGRPSQKDLRAAALSVMLGKRYLPRRIRRAHAVPIRRLLERVRGHEDLLLLEGAADDLNSQRQDRRRAPHASRHHDARKAAEVPDPTEDWRGWKAALVGNRVPARGDEHVEFREGRLHSVDEARSKLEGALVDGGGDQGARRELTADRAFLPVVHPCAKIRPMISGRLSDSDNALARVSDRPVNG